MRGIRGFVGGVNAPHASRWLLVTATVLLTAWLQAHILLAALHDDGGTVRNAIAVYNSGQARDQVAGAVDWALSTGGELSGATTQLAPVKSAIAVMLRSGQISAPVAHALVTELTGLRDDALAQFASDGATHALTIDLAPVLAAFGITATPELAKALGAASASHLSLPLMDAASVQTLRTRYRIAVLLDRWGLLVAAVLALAGVVLSRRPLRTLAIALGIGGVSCLIALPLFNVLDDWLLGGGIGPWSVLVAPLVESATAELRPWLLPLGIALLLAAVGAGTAWLFTTRGRTASVPDRPSVDGEGGRSGGAGDLRQHAVNEGS
jgi:hypothetical protein